MEEKTGRGTESQRGRFTVDRERQSLVQTVCFKW